MWVWWVISVIILSSAIIFALYIFWGSYKITPVKKSLKFNDLFTQNYSFTKQQVIDSLKLKLQSVEHNSFRYFNELKKLQQRIQALEKGKTTVAEDDDENWQELYYQLYEEKEKMESKLDITTQNLEETENNFNELKLKQEVWNEKQSEYENELNQAHSLQNKIGELQRELNGSLARETDLQQELELQKKVFEELEQLQQQYANIKAEADELRGRIKEINNRDILLQQKINRLTEHESMMEISEYEKMDIRKTVEEIILENEALALKLQELHEKLTVEKYA